MQPVEESGYPVHTWNVQTTSRRRNGEVGATEWLGKLSQGCLKPRQTAFLKVIFLTLVSVPSVQLWR